MTEKWPQPLDRGDRAERDRMLDNMTDSFLRGCGVLGVAGGLFFAGLKFILISNGWANASLLDKVGIALPFLAGSLLLGAAGWHLAKAIHGLTLFWKPSITERTASIIAFGLSFVVVVLAVELFYVVVYEMAQNL